MSTRILYAITELDVGGAEKALAQLATRLDRDAFAPEVACLAGQGPIAALLRQNGVPVHLLKARGKLDVRALWRLRKLCRTADIVHSFLFHANIAARLAAIATGTAAVISAARVAERSRPRRRTLECRTHRLVDAEVCVSNGVRDFLAAGGFPRTKLVVIPNGVDVARFEGRDPAFKGRMGLSRDTRLVTTIGRLHEQKGIAAFLHAAASILQSRSDCHFLVVGTGPLEADLRRLAAELHIARHVAFLGYTDRVAEVLKATDVFVLASLWEGMPNAVLEAMAAATPVVATRVEGTEDVVEDGRTGLLVPPGDTPGLVNSILKLLDHPALAAEQGQAAQAHVRRHFPLETMVRRHEELYIELLARTSHQARA